MNARAGLCELTNNQHDASCREQGAGVLRGNTHNRRSPFSRDTYCRLAKCEGIQATVEKAVLCIVPQGMEHNGDDPRTKNRFHQLDSTVNNTSSRRRVYLRRVEHEHPPAFGFSPRSTFVSPAYRAGSTNLHFSCTAHPNPWNSPLVRRERVLAQNLASP